MALVERMACVAHRQKGTCSSRSQRAAERARELSEATRRINRIVDAIAEGTASSALKSKLGELEAQKAALEAEQGSSQASPVSLHPRLPEVYRRLVNKLETALDKSPTEKAMAAEALRTLIERIQVHPGEKPGEAMIELIGSAPAILAFAEGQQQSRSGNKAGTAAADLLKVVVPRARTYQLQQLPELRVMV